MATTTALVKILSLNYSCNTKAAGLGEFFLLRNISTLWYIAINMTTK